MSWPTPIFPAPPTGSRGGPVQSGQACISVERVYVRHRSMPGLSHCSPSRSARSGKGADNGTYSTDVGGLVTKPQLEIVKSHVQDAVAHGATIATGGKTTGDSGFFEPTILLDVDHSMACMRDETFGPTIPVMKVADEEEAIRLANDSQYGLSATVWTKDISTDSTSRNGSRSAPSTSTTLIPTCSAFRCRRRLEKLRPRLPAGRPAGHPEVLPSAGHHRAACARMENELLWYPYSHRRGRTVGALLRFFVAGDVRRRLRLPTGRRSRNHLAPASGAK